MSSAVVWAAIGGGVVGFWVGVGLFCALALSKAQDSAQPEADGG